MFMGLKLGKGDEATIVVHRPDREEAFRGLEELGWWEIPEMLGDDVGEGAQPDPIAGNVKTSASA